MELDFQTGALLLLIAAVVAMLTRRVRFPYSVGLVAAGIFLAVLPFAPKVSLTKDLIFTALLPPLLFEAAFNIQWNQLRRDFSLIVFLATLGVALSACVTALGMHYLAHWRWLGALVFGVLIAATDPVSVIAIFKEAKAQGLDGCNELLTLDPTIRGLGPMERFRRSLKLIELTLDETMQCSVKTPPRNCRDCSTRPGKSLKLV
jgi:hypothetical protein